MKNTSTIGHSSKHTFLPTTTFVESRVSVCPPLHVSQSPWLQQQLSSATTVCIYCLQVSSHDSCCTNLLEMEVLEREKDGQEIGWPFTTVCSPTVAHKEKPTVLGQC